MVDMKSIFGGGVGKRKWTERRGGAKSETMMGVPVSGLRGGGGQEGLGGRRGGVGEEDGGGRDVEEAELADELRELGALSCCVSV